MFLPLPNQLEFAAHLHRTHGENQPDIAIRYLVSTRGIKIPRLLCCYSPMLLEGLTDHSRAALYCPKCGRRQLVATENLNLCATSSKGGSRQDRSGLRTQKT